MKPARGLAVLFGAAALTTAATRTRSPQPPASVLVVQVGDAATGTFIADAQVRLPSIGRVARTKWDGEAQFNDLPDGKYRIQVRAIGYAPGDVDIQLAGDTVPVHFNLERLSSLDTVRVRAERVRLGLKEFEDRRQTRIGRYYTDSTLMEHRAQGMRTFLATRVPGLTVNGRGVVVWGDGCRVNFWLDGFELRDFDLDALRLQEFAGMEVYSQVTVPVKYKPSNGACSIVLLWTKW